MGSFVALRGGDIALIPRLVAHLADDIALVAGLIALAAGLVANFSGALRGLSAVRIHPCDAT